MEYLNYLIYPIAGLLCLLALGGLNTKHRGVVIASVVSLALNGYAMLQFVWWPIPVSIASDFVFKRLFGDPGARPVKQENASGPIDVYLLGADPLTWGSRADPLARVAMQVFILGMVDMQRNAEGLSYDEFVTEYGSILERHELSPSIAVAEFVDAIGRVASQNGEVENLMREGAQSIRSYIVDSDTEAPVDLARVLHYARTNESVFEPLTRFS